MSASGQPPSDATPLPGGTLAAPAREEAVSPAAATVAVTPQPRDPIALADEPGTPLPTVAREHYAIEGEIQRGGMGRVLRARDLRLGRDVAIKELLAPDDPTAIAVLERRFRREVEITARLQHPGIVGLYEAGRWPTGEPFYAMRLLAGGRSLARAILDARDLPSRLALLPHLVAACDALAYAHDQRVIHRDLKPSNVMVGPFGETVVIDWGLAKDLAARDRSDEEDGDEAVSYARGDGGASLTRGDLIGTPQYMPPEQAERRPVDERADVYSLGAMLYHLLAGAPPYGGSDAMQIVAWVAREAPAPLGSLVAEVPEELLSIVTRAMARDPAERYPTARELAADLKRFSTGQLVPSHRYGPIAIAGRWLRRHRAATVVAVIGALALGALGVTLVGRARRERDRLAEERRAAIERRDELVLERARAALGRDPSAVPAELVALPLDSPRWGAARMLAAAAEAAGLSRSLAHDGPVEDLAFAPDGRVLVTASGESALVWDLATGSARRLRAGSAILDEVALSRDGRTVAAASLEEGVSAWGLPEGTPIRIAPGRRARHVALSSDGALLAASDDDGGLSLWDLRARNERWHVAAPAPIAHAPVLSPDGKLVAVATTRGDLRLFSTESGATRALAGRAGSPSAPAFSPDGARLAIGAADGAVLVFDVASGERAVAQGHSAAVDRVVFSPDGTTLASASRDGSARLWRLAPRGATGARAVTPGDAARGPVLRAGDGWLSDVAFAPDGKLLATASRGGVVRVWDPASGQSRALVGHRDWVRRVAFAPDGATLASASRDRTVRLWDLAGSPSRFLARVDGTLQHLAVSPDGKLAIAAAATGAITRIDLASGATTLLVGHGDAITHLAFSPDGARLATASRDRTARVWDLASGASRVLGGHGDRVTWVAFSPDGTRVLTASADKALRVWPVAGPGEGGAPTVIDGGEWLARADWLADGRIAATSDGGATRVWSADGRRYDGTLVQGAPLAWSQRHTLVAWGDAEQQLEVRALVAEVARGIDANASWRFAGHDAPLDALAFSPDESWLASAAADGTVRLWPLPAPSPPPTDEPRVLATARARVTLLAFSPDGTTLAAAGGDRAWLWDVATGEPRALPATSGLLSWQPFTPDRPDGADGRTLVVAGPGGAVWRVRDDLPRDPASLRAWLDARRSLSR